MTNTPNTNLPVSPITPRQLFLQMAVHFGIGREVAALLQDRPAPEQPGLGPTLRNGRYAWGGTIHGCFVRSGVSRSQLSFYENGGQKNPGVRTIQALSYGYKVPFAAIIMAVLADMAREVPAAPGAAPEPVPVVRKRKRNT